jgi:plastocyanin
MARSFRFTLIIFPFLFVTVPAFAVDYNGVVKIVEKGKSAAKSEYEDAIIYFVPDEPVSMEAAAKETKEMKMEKKKFLPRVLPVTVGTEVNFPNFDPILHNAFSTSTNNNFDLGLYSGGEKGSAIFEKPGLVRVYCNVHHAMVAYILVFDNSFYTNLSNDGSFTLKGLPATSGTLYLWHPRAKVLKQEVNLASASSGETFKIELTKRRIPKHNNKLGKSYRKARERNY